MAKELRYVGKSLSNADVYGKVTGSLEYCKDMQGGQTLYMALKHSDIAHGLIQTIDCAKAKEVPGVVKIYTWENTPDTLYDRGRVAHYEQMPNQERLFDAHVRFWGERVAAVVAVSQEAACRAVDLIQVTYQTLPGAITADEAEAPQAPKIHPEGNVYTAPVQDRGDYSSLKEGEIFKTYTHIGRMTHLSMETSCTLARYDKGTGRLTVYTGCQTVFGIRSTLADFLGMPYSKVRVVKAPMGGSFGCKQETLTEPLAAYAARDLKAEVLLSYTREEQIQNTMLKHSLDEWVESRITKEGKLLGLSFKVRLDSGAYQTVSPSYCRTIGGKLGKVYNIPHIHFEGKAVCTNTPVNGSFRSWGSCEAAMGLETHMNQAAEKLGIDPVEFRLRNVLEPYAPEKMHHTHVGNVHFRECLTKGAEKFDWTRRRQECEKRNKAGGRYRYGSGMALYSHTSSFYPYQTDVATAIARLQEDGTVIIHVGIHDHGCGTVMAMKKIAAEILEIDLEKVEVFEADTQVTMYDYGCYASRTIYVLGKAVEECTRRLLELGRKTAAAMFQCMESAVKYQDGEFYLETEPSKRGDLRQVSEYALSVQGKDIYQVCTVNSRENPGTAAAHFTMVRVDTYTGAVKVLNCLSVHDIGRAINPDMCIGQVGSGIQQGMGMALCEEIKIHPQTGQTLITNFKNYEVTNAVDMPEYDVLFIEEPEEYGPFGAKAIGEVVVVPVAPAIVAAVNQALGTEIGSVPITREIILEELEKQERSRKS